MNLFRRESANVTENGSNLFWYHLFEVGNSRHARAFRAANSVAFLGQRTGQRQIQTSPAPKADGAISATASETSKICLRKRRAASKSPPQNSFATKAAFGNSAAEILRLASSRWFAALSKSSIHFQKNKLSITSQKSFNWRF